MSTLICSRQISREEALREMGKDSYSPDRLKEDKDFVIKKLRLTEGEFDEIISHPVKTFRDYSSNHQILYSFPSVINFIKKVATDRR